jgi:hypothetical protein
MVQDSASEFWGFWSFWGFQGFLLNLFWVVMTVSTQHLVLYGAGFCIKKEGV